MTTSRLLIQTRIGWHVPGEVNVRDVGGHVIGLNVTEENVEQLVSQILDEIEALLHNQPAAGFELLSRAKR